LKFLLTFLLAGVKPTHVENIPEVERYIRECRVDLSRARCQQENIAVVFRVFHCPHCRRCTMKYEKHSYLVNRCISANNLPLYYLHILVENVNIFIVFWSLILTFDERIDSDLIYFIMYLTCALAHQCLYFKKILVHTKTMLTGETLHERNMGMKLHFKNDRQVSMMERMQGITSSVINPFNKGLIKNVIEFFLPAFTMCRK
jgi:hypothetical protein